MEILAVQRSESGQVRVRAVVRLQIADGAADLLTLACQETGAHHLADDFGDAALLPG
jgi:hypothetical protein